LLVEHEFKQHPTDAAGLLGHAIQWDGQVLRLWPDNTWHAGPLGLTGKPTLARKSTSRRSA